jgi:hypothetical protein
MEKAMKITGFWDVTRYRLLDVTDVSEERAVSSFGYSI